jgi:hypothetical protein
MADETNLNEGQLLVPLSLITCFFCTKEEVRKCRKCQRNFCTDHSHRYSPDFCQECFKNLSIIADKFIRTSEEYDHQNDQVVTRRETCDRLRLDGADYPFLTMWINKLTDEETQAVYEFHYFIVKLIEHDNEVRKIGKQAKLRQYPVQTVKTTEVKVRRETRPLDLAAELKKKFPGLPQHVIDSMVAASKGATP